MTTENQPSKHAAHKTQRVSFRCSTLRLYFDKAACAVRRSVRPITSALTQPTTRRHVFRTCNEHETHTGSAMAVKNAQHISHRRCTSMNLARAANLSCGPRIAGGNLALWRSVRRVSNLGDTSTGCAVRHNRGVIRVAPALE